MITGKKHGQGWPLGSDIKKTRPGALFLWEAWRVIGAKVNNLFSIAQNFNKNLHNKLGTLSIYQTASACGISDKSPNYLITYD